MLWRRARALVNGEDLQMVRPDMTSWTYCHVSDIHVGTPKSFRYEPAWVENWRQARQQIIELNPDFLTVGGDMTRDGLFHPYELEQIKADLDRLPFMTRVIPGNHEIGNKVKQKEKNTSGPESTTVQSSYIRQYESVFGSSQWSFVYKNIRFSAFNALLAGSGLPEEVRMWEWLEAQVREPHVNHQVWIIHPALFLNEPEEVNWDMHRNRREWYFSVDDPHRSRILRVFKKTETSLVISGHLHIVRKVVRGEMTFQYAPSTAFIYRQHHIRDGRNALGFLKCIVDEKGVHPEFVPLKNVSHQKGYGPGGNPAPQDRDYSLSWEKPALKANH